MKKLLFVLCLLFALPVSASTVSDGAIVKTDSSPDIYIVKYSGGKMYKRLVLNEKVFSSYGHLKWENVITISQDYMDTFKTSDLVRVDGSLDTYQLVPNGDLGDKYLIVNTSGYDLNSVYVINDTDFNNYKLVGSKGEIENKKDEETSGSNDEEDLSSYEEALKKIEAVLDGYDTDIEETNAKIKTYTEKIESIKAKYPDLSSLTDEKLANYDKVGSIKVRAKYKQSYLSELNPAQSKLEELNSDKEELEAKKIKLVKVKYEVKAYIKKGTDIPAEDLAYLSSLDIEI